MSTKKWVAAVLAVVVASPFAVAALDAIGIGPNWEVDVAEWESGYSWTYDTSLEVALDGYDPEETHSMNLKAEGDHIYTVANTTAEYGNISLYALVEQFVPTKVSEGDEIFYEADVEGSPDAALEPTISPQMCLGQCFGGHSYFTKENLNPFYEETWMNPMQDDELELRLLDFPLKSGASWTVYRTDYPIDFPGVADPFEQLDAHVAGRDHVNLPEIGTMEAVRVEAAMTKESKESFQRLFDQLPSEAGSFEFDMDYKMTYWYAPEAKNIVRSDLHQMQEFSAQFQGESAKMAMSIDSTSILSDYSLEALPERSVEETNKLQEFVKDLPDVTELSNKTWPFSLAADQYSVNVGDEESVNLGVLEGDRNGETTASTFAEIPDGMSLKWRHRYLSQDGGPVEEWYSGDTLTLAPQEHGLQELTAYLLDEERHLVALDSTIIEGYYQSTLTSSNPLPQTSNLRFPANAFLDHVKVELDPGNAALGRLSLTGTYSDDSQQSDSKTISGSDEITLQAEDPYLTSEWVASFSENLRVGEMKMTATVRYDRSMNFSAAEGMSDGEPESSSGWIALADEECSLMFASCVMDHVLGGFLEPSSGHTQARITGPLR